MAASPVPIVPSSVSRSRRRPLSLTPRRLEANRRNAARSSGPRTPAGKARVARNAIKHGFFVAHEKWTPTQSREYEKLLEGLRKDFKPAGVIEESWVATIARSYVRRAALRQYENIAALKYHQQEDSRLNQRIAAAEPAEAAFLEAGRDHLRGAGLWRPTLPGPRETNAIIRYSGSLERTIRRATGELEGLKRLRIGATSSLSKTPKQTHFEASPRSVLSAARRTSSGTTPAAEGATARTASTAATSPAKTQKQTHFVSPATEEKIAKTNPLSSMFTGNRHERRRANALARRC